ncbi:hypothetical protein BAU15_13645 [Enterococcus sp. JM4C]|uniref:helix-turn-helix domain-containing protein n=1 Tax=Candidatus Enterococcus huntleyi TaxID=1857217 RepID=UPI0013795CE3|nr:helix-turn-helix domain-containing protein [Enterococcus sp. JM4C]KAF1298317.1 hypothetical protein BAU15_13645 [Enterococcus sp. JM4C]
MVEVTSVNKGQLREIYPDAQVKKMASSDSEVLSIPMDEGYLWIDKKELSERERRLLQMFVPNEKIQQGATHEWYGILFKQQPVKKEGTFRVIQIQLQKKADFLLKEWKQNFQEMFPHWVDLFFYTERDVLLVEQQAEANFSIEELEGIFLTLDADFETNSKVFVGSFYSSQENLAELFLEEQEIFQEELDFVKSQHVFSIANVALHYYTKTKMQKSAVIQNYKKNLVIDQEMSDIIQTLWSNQGNISSTAKELFMHRNTLQYRLEKFQEASGLNVRHMDELILCYLLLLN